MAKTILSAQDRLEIIAAGDARKQLTNKHLGQRYGVSPDTIKNIIHNEVCKRRIRRNIESAKRKLNANPVDVDMQSTP